MSQNTQNPSQKNPPQNQAQLQNNNTDINCTLHPCRIKYFCVEKNCSGEFRAACGECFTEGPHQGHKIIQIAEYELSLKTNYQKLQSQVGSIDNTQTLIEKVNKLFQNLKNKVETTLDQAKQHVLREIFSQQDKKETEQFKLLNLRIKQLKKCFFHGGAAKFPKNIGDFSLDLYNMDAELLEYLNLLKQERDNYIKPFEQNYSQITQKIDDLIKNEIANIYKISPFYPMKFNKNNFKGEIQPIEGHQNKINFGVKFIHNQTSHKKQQLDSDQKINEIQNFIFTCAKDNSLRLWNLGCGEANSENFKPSLWKTYMFENKEITALCQLDYDHLVTGNSDGYIQVWDIRDASCKAKFSHLDENNKNFKPQHNQSENFIDYNENENQYHDEEVQESVLLRNAEKAVQLKKITYLLQVNEQIVVAGYADGDIRVWDINQGKILDLFNFYETTYDNKVQQEQLAIHKIAKLNQWVLVSTGTKIKEDQTIQQQQKQSDEKNDPENSLVNSVQPAQKKQIKTQNEQNVVIVWNWLNQELIAEYSQHKDKIIDLIIYEKIIVSASKDNEIHIWDLNSAKTLKILQNTHQGIKAITQLSDNIFASCGDDLFIKLWEIQPENLHENYEDFDVKILQQVGKMAPKNENEVQLLKQKPNSLIYLQRLSETEMVVGSLQPPYLQLIN